ncbi:CHAT domain-containing tetratricopeptide repeat protein [Coleofasciculus sp. FACHB-501]|uniref:CHAT domain-containing tetratricopeptide repeat protein n=1 Tax=Cyanophyceae TaxID=3028117 RepID=UPI0016843F8E|nr:CHAT domain-containing tetratricopeptide repeat protein [Coleofasciculus sp. FACHB-501]MBD1837164.1 CHAT domain-containing protein [Coleofasciculus sp. FACHB-501]
MRRPKIGLMLFAMLVANGVTPVANLPAPLTAPQALAQTPNARKAEAERLDGQAFDQYLANQQEAALQSWQQALLLYQELKDRRGEELVLEKIDMVYETQADRLRKQGAGQYFTSQWAAALQSLEQSLLIYRDIKNRKGEALALGAIGLVHDSLGDYAKAIDYTQQQLGIGREIEDPLNERAALANLGGIYLNLGNYPKGIEYSQQVLALVAADGFPDPQAEGKALANLGAAYVSLGDYAKAIGYLQQQLANAREIEDRRSEGAALGNLGAAYSNLGDYAKAIEYSQQQLAIVREIKNRRSEGLALANLATAYIFLDDYTKAIDYTQQSLAIAREIKDRRNEGALLGNLGVAYRRLGDYAKAIEYSQQQLAIAQEIQNRESEGIALQNIGFTLYKQGNFVTAEPILMDGIKVLESIRAGLGSNDANKVSIFERQVGTYQTLQKVLIAQSKTEPALEIAERGRARAFVELLADRLQDDRLQVEGSAPPSNLQPPTIEQIKQIAKAQTSTLVQYSIIYDTFKVQGKQKAQESELYIWVIKPTGEVTFRTADLKPLWQKQNISLEELVTSSRDSIGVRGRGLAVASKVDKTSTNKRLQQLHQLLIQPIAGLLPKDPNDRIIFIPQRELFLVPFPALQDASGKYLIEQHTIVTAPAIQVLELTRKQRQRVSGKEVLVVGNPIMPNVAPKIGEKSEPLSQLPGAEQEAKAIASLLKTKPLIGKQATKIAIAQQMPKAKIIHLATHGLLDDFQGLGVPGAIALAPSEQDTGLLTASEILDMKLNAELVVLSACDTGRGKITGDGVIGLSRSLITAGIRSVIVSLWSVPDAPTASLMTEFYQNFQKNPDKAQAMRQAMLTTMKQHPDPKDWAAFTLIGEAQ